MREIRWTEKAEDHIAAHNVTPDEVEQVVSTRPRLVLTGREGTKYVFGTTNAGRHLLVVLVEAIDGRDYVSPQETWSTLNARPSGERGGEQHEQA